ncbi:MAG: orotidine 5-phosphate decarboxylase [Thermoprotei archaeon]|nr:MAG: orotidine 5-phosphate decarboxylase [Thermoprotei archaeon]
MIKIQVALDFTDEKNAMKMASKICNMDNVMLEAGTPLIKASGVSILRKLRELCPGVELVADMKIMDVGDIEAELAFKNGADYTTVLGVASRETIRKVIDVSRKFGARTIVDLIEVKDLEAFLRKIDGLKPDILCIHRGIDVEISRCWDTGDIREIIKYLKDKVGSKIAVAGGITDKTAPTFIEAGADILVIGRYITRSKNPREAIKKVFQSIGQK